MSAVVTAAGQIRGIRELRNRSDHPKTPNEVFGREVSLLTEAGAGEHLGETLRVTVFSGSHPSIHSLRQGDRVHGWILDLSVGKYGLSAVYQGEELSTDLSAGIDDYASSLS